MVAIIPCLPSGDNLPSLPCIRRNQSRCPQFQGDASDSVRIIRAPSDSLFFPECLRGPYTRPRSSSSSLYVHTFAIYATPIFSSSSTYRMASSAETSLICPSSTLTSQLLVRRVHCKVFPLRVRKDVPPVFPPELPIMAITEEIPQPILWVASSDLGHPFLAATWLMVYFIIVIFVSLHFIFTFILYRYSHLCQHFFTKIKIFFRNFCGIFYGKLFCVLTCGYFTRVSRRSVLFSMNIFLLPIAKKKPPEIYLRAICYCLCGDEYKHKEQIKFTKDITFVIRAQAVHAIGTKSCTKLPSGYEKAR